MRILLALVFSVGLFAQASMADDTSRFIGERLTAQYNANVLKAKGDSAKKTKLNNIYKAAMAKIGKINGMAAKPIATKAVSDMKAVF